MKKAIPLLLSVILIFAFAAPGFAYASDGNTVEDQQSEHDHNGDCYDFEYVFFDEVVISDDASQTVTLDNVLCTALGHTKGTLLGTYYDYTNPSIDTYCSYMRYYGTYLCGRCNTVFDVLENTSYNLHNLVPSYQGTIMQGMYCTKCNYRSWK